MSKHSAIILHFALLFWRFGDVNFFTGQFFGSYSSSMNRITDANRFQYYHSPSDGQSSERIYKHGEANCIVITDNLLLFFTKIWY